MGLSVLSLFAGAGGMDIGLARAGFEHFGLIELAHNQRKSIKHNTDWPLLDTGDINEVAEFLKPRDLGLVKGDLSLIAGGPPCQPFSTAAQWAAAGRQGMLDTRARTVVSTLKLVSKFLPRAVLFENVKGFVQGKNSALAFLQDEFERINEVEGTKYRISVLMMNAAHYGVPQNRQRAIVVALRDGGEFHPPAATHVDEPRTAWDAIGDMRVLNPPLARGKWSDLLPSIPEGRNYLWLTSRGGGPEIFGYRTRYWNFLLKLDRNLPAWTLSASPGPSTGPFHWENRPLAVEEQIRLQTFPDDWQFSGDHRSQTLQIGNATPPLLAEVLGQSLRAALGGPDSSAPTLLRGANAKKPPLHPPLAPLHSKFSGLVGAKAEHAGTGLGPSPRTIHSSAETEALN